ncbi:hypothetical protein EDC94DRAFT_589081 [Helicostylum pulchrum]|nr:hypothetical protein EDC94DRAFT_589081 [Helicostylum pulchrum]
MDSELEFMVGVTIVGLICRTQNTAAIAMNGAIKNSSYQERIAAQCKHELYRYTRIIKKNIYAILWKVLKTKNGILIKEVRGTAVCSNKHCILALKNETHKGRDAVSATAICISGSTMLLLKTQHPSFCYNDYNSETNTDDFRKIADVFLNRSTSRPAIDYGITRET